MLLTLRTRENFREMTLRCCVREVSLAKVAVVYAAAVRVADGGGLRTARSCEGAWAAARVRGRL